MKSASDPRHILRRTIVKDLFANEFHDQTSSIPTVNKILRNLFKIDKIIVKAAPEWPLDRINKVDLAVLRLAVWEIMEDKIPVKAIIDEAVELAKEYGSDGSSSFINGVLATIIKKHAKDK